jgi:hypothetical protein
MVDTVKIYFYDDLLLIVIFIKDCGNFNSVLFYHILHYLRQALLTVIGGF